MATPFIFKQFALQQEKAAFKLGTDSVVLGSWLPKTNYKRILDLGSGTGILSLMMAQRFKQAIIIGLEIDQDSADNTAFNFKSSPWSSRLKLIHLDAIEWSKKNALEKFDLIITNPPYFKNSLKNPDERKSIARHAHKLNNLEIIDFAIMHLNQEGQLACVLPTREFELFELAANSKNLYLNKRCEVSSFVETEVIRKMGVFSFKQQVLAAERHYLYNRDKSRSAWYTNISNEFYIK